MCVGTLALFDIVTSSWLIFVCAGVLSTIPFIVAVFNRSVVLKLFQSFQVHYVWLCSFVMALSASFLWKNSPIKVAAHWLVLPTLLVAGCMDAFPEKGRVLTTRIFSVVNLSGLVLIAMAVINGIHNGDHISNVSFAILNRSLELSSVFLASLGGLVPFGLKNLFWNMHSPGSLVVLEGEIVSVKLDPDVLLVLQSAHTFLFSERKLANGSMQKSDRNCSYDGGHLKANYTATNNKKLTQVMPEPLTH